jgi:hypothetical protein
MKRLFFLVFSCVAFCAVSQTDSVLSVPPIVKNSIYIELVGNPTLYAFNYDRILFKTKYLALNATVGGTYILGDGSNNTGVKKMLQMPDELNHAKYILGGTMMFRKELFWEMFNIQKVAKNRMGKVSYVELGFYHIWNNPKTSPSNLPGGTFERGHPWNNIYIGYNLFRTKPGLFLRFGAMIYLFKKGPNIIDEISSGYRVSPLPFPRIIAGYTF